MLSGQPGRTLSVLKAEFVLFYNIPKYFTRSCIFETRAELNMRASLNFLGEKRLGKCSLYSCKTVNDANIYITDTHKSSWIWLSSIWDFFLCWNPICRYLHPRFKNKQRWQKAIGLTSSIHDKKWYIRNWNAFVFRVYIQTHTHLAIVISLWLNENLKDYHRVLNHIHKRERAEFYKNYTANDHRAGWLYRKRSEYKLINRTIDRTVVL